MCIAAEEDGKEEGKETSTPQQYGKRAALACMVDDDTSGHTVPNDRVAELAAQLASTRVKDVMPHAFVAEAIAPIAEKCASLGKDMHLLLLGCNIIAHRSRA